TPLFPLLAHTDISVAGSVLVSLTLLIREYAGSNSFAFRTRGARQKPYAASAHASMAAVS
ncbi:MAG: hypothetical protein K2P59_11420, partial [Acetatifactor sp.]|nr:hypothetical protein [Acetatifactor sp.]